MKQFVMLALGLMAATAYAAKGISGGGNSGMPPVAAPQTGVYFNANGKYAGTTTTVNGGTNYYQDGKYQGQAPATSNLYLNQQGQVQQISK